MVGKTLYSIGFPYVHLEMCEGHALSDKKFNVIFFSCYIYYLSSQKKLDLIEMFVSFWGKLVYLEDEMCE